MKTFSVHLTQSVHIKINAESEGEILEAIKDLSPRNLEEHVIGNAGNGWEVDDIDESSATVYPDTVLVDGAFYHPADVPEDR
jgi:hypothetical protein